MLEQQGVGTDRAEPPEPGAGEETEHGLRLDIARELHERVAAMNVENFLVRPTREWVETYAEWDAWGDLTPEKAGDIARHLAGLPSTRTDDDEDAKRFDLLLLRLQLGRLDGDAVTFERLRKQVQDIATALLSQTAIPAVKEREQLLDDLSGDQWWVDVTLPMLEGAALRHHVSVHDLADAVLTAGQGQPVPEPPLRKILWMEWGDLLA